MPKVSIIVPVYNEEEYVSTCLDSLINQTLDDIEIILIDDNSTDNSLNILLDYAKKYPNIKVYHNEKNIGLGLALNVGLKACRNELVARMDTDDISKPDRCKKQLKRFEEKPELAIVGAWVDEFTVSPDQVVSTRAVPIDSDSIYNFAKKRSAFNHPAVMYRRSAVLKQGGYSDLRRNQDVDLFGRMLFAGEKAENIGEALLWFRSNDDLAKRRKSWDNTWSYIDTIKRFWKMGYSSFGDFAMVAVAQTGMYLMPVKLQHWVYKKFLRR